MNEFLVRSVIPGQTVQSFATDGNNPFVFRVIGFSPVLLPAENAFQRFVQDT